MANPFVAEIRILPFNFAPIGWAFCDGQLMAISQNTALFALLGVTYGGDGKSTFALPDMQGNVPLHIGGSQPGPGLTSRALGERSGVESVTLLVSEMPVHTHTLQASSTVATKPTPAGNAFGRVTGATPYASGSPDTNFAFQALPPAGGGLPHNNMMPYLTLNFCIALQGVFPPRQ
jgi:microcystin-dependent protein